MGEFKQIKSDTRQWASGRVKLSLIGKPDKPDTYYIILEKDFFGRGAPDAQRFNLRAHDWENLKRLIDGTGKRDGLGTTANWTSTVPNDEHVADLIAENPGLVEVVLSSPNIGNFSGASLEALDRLAERVFEVKKETLDLIFKRLAESSVEGLQSFSDLLGDLRLNHVALLSGLVYQKIKILDLLEKVVRNTDSSERAVHEIYEKNPWLLGRGFEIAQSDRMLAEYLNVNVKDDPEVRRRPDLIVKRVPYSNDVIIIELKAPGIKLKAEHIGQVLTYKALVKNYKPNAGAIHCFLYGYEKSSTFAESSDVTIKTFSELVTELRDEYNEYSAVLESGGQDVDDSLLHFGQESF